MVVIFVHVCTKHSADCNVGFLRTCRIAIKQLQGEKPAYQHGADKWWGEVIRRTAVGAGADPSGALTPMLDERCRVSDHDGVETAVERSLDQVVPRLLERFSSKEGYRLFDDSLSCCLCTTRLHGYLLTNTFSAKSKRQRSEDWSGEQHGYADE